MQFVSIRAFSFAKWNNFSNSYPSKVARFFKMQAAAKIATDVKLSLDRISGEKLNSAIQPLLLFSRSFFDVPQFWEK
jgi:hypothetical protein